MMMKYNFDQEISRYHTNSLKYDVADDVLPLWVADMDFASPQEVQDAIIKKAKLGIYGYNITPEAFFQSVSSWWERRHHITFDPSWMVYSSGIVAAISSMVRKLTTVGENVLIQSPVYNIFFNSIYNNGRNILSSDLVYENHAYHIDFADLEAKMALPQTTLMILCNPHNPIGKIYSQEDLAHIGTLARRYGVIVISDEIHCDLTSPHHEYVPFALASKENLDTCITCVAASKTFNLAGLQSACIIVKDPFLRHKVFRGINTDEVGEPNCFAMEANIAAFTYGDQYVDELNIYIDKNKKYVEEYFNKYLPKLYVIHSEATYLLWIDISSYGIDSDLLCEQLLNNKLKVCPGSEYGTNGKYFIRINLATPLAKVKKACDIIKKTLECE
jgi:cystathionine beta-lyase